MTERDLIYIKAKDYEGVLEEREILSWFEIAGASWIHDGDPKKPHAGYSGLCANACFDFSRIIKYPNFTEVLARQLAGRLRENGMDRIGWVISSISSYFSYEVAKAVGAIYNFLEEYPDDSEGIKRELRWPIKAGVKVLQVEEFIDNYLNFQQVRLSIKMELQKKEIKFLPIVGALACLSPKFSESPDDEEKIIPLVGNDFWITKQKDCPLCEVGSPRWHPYSLVR